MAVAVALPFKVTAKAGADRLPKNGLRHSLMQPIRSGGNEAGAVPHPLHAQWFGGRQGQMKILSATTTAIALLAPGLAAQAPPHAPDSLVELSSQMRSLSRRVAPAVVQILVTGYRSSAPESAHAVSLLGREESSGSGILVDPDGYIVTNAHVVTAAISIRVVLSYSTPDAPPDDAAGLETIPARIVGLDTESDLAVLKIERDHLPALKFMDSDQLRQGDLVLAIGAPLGLRNSVSFGMVSSPARFIGDDNPAVYIQTDASINPGNSGGALVNMSGLVAGLNTFIVSQSGGNEGLGFAIPSNIVRDVYWQLRKTGRVHRGEIGVYAQNITPVMAKGLALARDHGVIVADMDKDSPADLAGLQRGDIILSLDGQRLASAGQLESRIYRRPAGDKLDLQVLRGQTQLHIAPVIRERTEKTDLLARLANPEQNLVERLGILCIPIDKDVAAMLPDLRRQYGLIVAAKAEGGQSQYIDLQPGDVIDAINNLPAPFISTLRSALENMKPGDPVVLRIERGGRFQYVAFELDR